MKKIVTKINEQPITKGVCGQAMKDNEGLGINNLEKRTTYE